MSSLDRSYTYLEPSVLLPIRPTRLTKTVLHVRWSPSVPLWTLDDLTALAWLPTDSDHKYSGIITHHAAITITVQNAGRLSVTVAVTVAQRYNRGGGRSGCRCGSLIVIRYVNLLQLTLRLYSFHSFLLDIPIRRFPHVIIFDYVFQRFPR